MTTQTAWACLGWPLIFCAVALLAATIARSRPPRRGIRVNDLSRWEQYGGTLKRPPPPGPSQ